jgi:hypothetical protein
MDTQPIEGKFEGWAIVELFGHQREVGYVTSQVFGTAILFRIDTPELPEREYSLERPEQVKHEGVYLWATVGSKVKRASVPAKTKLVGPSAIYAMTPTTEETARMAIERLIVPPLILLELAKAKMLPAANDHICAECGESLIGGEPHRNDCSLNDRICAECGESLIGGEPHRSDCSLDEDENNEGERCCSE